jgi:hypothetical protein
MTDPDLMERIYAAAVDASEDNRFSTKSLARFSPRAESYAIRPVGLDYLRPTKT